MVQHGRQRASPRLVRPGFAPSLLSLVALRLALAVGSVVVVVVVMMMMMRQHLLDLLQPLLYLHRHLPRPPRTRRRPRRRGLVAQRGRLSLLVDGLHVDVEHGPIL